MVANGSLPRHWAATLILLCILYWSFRLSVYDFWSTTATKGLLDISEGERTRPDMSEDLEKHISDAEAADYASPKTYPSRFPRIVWQTASEKGKEQYAKNAETWKKVQGFQYNFLSGKLS